MADNEYEFFDTDYLRTLKDSGSAIADLEIPDTPVSVERDGSDEDDASEVNSNSTDSDDEVPPTLQQVEKLLMEQSVTQTFDALLGTQEKAAKRLRTLKRHVSDADKGLEPDADLQYQRKESAKNMREVLSGVRQNLRHMSCTKFGDLRSGVLDKIRAGLDITTDLSRRALR